MEDKRVADAIKYFVYSKFLDEPVSSLDIKNQGIILELMESLAKNGISIVFTTHLPLHAYSIANVAMLMIAKDRYESGPAKEILREDLLTELYGVNIKKLDFKEQGRDLSAFLPIYKP